jgi:hypothetical protein
MVKHKNDFDIMEEEVAKKQDDPSTILPKVNWDAKHKPSVIANSALELKMAQFVHDEVTQMFDLLYKLPQFDQGEVFKLH